ncbi:WD40-repeat-containing domain [Pseudocohnilembus persalinus]|uniref:WD40-repeat-containing domain n=1 Tax=Pseudocohnilembus persalinus TaxID=266149 RepID=A0A0V0QHV0_PSEPJ|nr:WD40-repeat-containing domain [Pseudocohnilembus persalinus]|eukprot:KRX01707.1 WD40-repeat-containing domain [Pseudocohnilembus persalinus]
MEIDQSNWYERDLEPIKKVDKAHLNSIETISFNPTQSNQLVTGSHDHTMKLWDTNKMTCTGTLEGHKEGVWASQFSSDGKTLLSASPDKTILIWDVAKAKPIQSLKEHKNKVYHANFNETSKLIASGGEDSRLIIWDLRKGTPLKIIKSDNKIIYSTKWSKCGNYLFTTEYGGIVKVFDTQKFNLLDQFGHYSESNRAWTCDMDFRDESKTGHHVFVGFENQMQMKILKFEPEKNKLELDFEFLAHLNPIKSLVVNGSKGYMATGCRDGSARVWETEKHGDKQYGYRNKTIANLNGHSDNVSSIAFMPGHDNIVATGSWDQGLRIFKF